MNISQGSRGTSSYRAPELVLGNGYTKKVDIWAVGCILYEIVIQQKAFEHDLAVGSYAASKSPLKIPPIDNGHSSAFFTTTIYETLHWEWNRRPSAQSLVSKFLKLNSSLLQLSSDKAAPNNSRIDAFAIPTIDALSSQLETSSETTSEIDRYPFAIPVVLVSITAPQRPTVPVQDYDPFANSLPRRSTGSLKPTPSEIKPRKAPVVIR